MLTREAERYYRHEVTFADPNNILIWHWDPAVCNGRRRLARREGRQTQQSGAVLWLILRTPGPGHRSAL